MRIKKEGSSNKFQMGNTLRKVRGTFKTKGQERNRDCGVSEEIKLFALRWEEIGRSIKDVGEEDGTSRGP